MVNVLHVQKEKSFSDYDYYIFKAAVEADVEDISEGYVTMTLNYMSSPLTIRVKEDTYKNMVTEGYHDRVKLDKLYGEPESGRWLEYAQKYGLPVIFVEGCPYLRALP